MINPISTYRIQFNKEFRFTDFKAIIPYLSNLGIKTIYASPIFEAVPGSTHGYDVTNPIKINPEIGTEEELREISRELKEHQMYWLQDIVPNHMAFHPKNEWLMDVLEKGQLSLYANYFDITWNSDLFKGQLMVPFLGNSLEECINNGEIKILSEDGKLQLGYFDNAYPLHPKSYNIILSQVKGPNDAITLLADQLNEVLHVEDAHILSEQWKEWLLQFNALQHNEDIVNKIAAAISKINEDKEVLKEVAASQVYRLCHWQETDTKINYRRFFTVNGLICLNIQDDNVFQHHHSLIKKYIDEGIFNGLRVDHIDGLFDPLTYLNNLRKLVGAEIYITVEKILEHGEQLPVNWPVQGTSGYDYLATINNLLTNKNAEGGFTQIYRQISHERSSIIEQVNDKKALILHNHMSGELENLYRLFLQSGLVNKKDLARVHPEDIKTAIAEFLIQCPVYRYYGNKFPLGEEEAAAIRKVLDNVKRTTESPEAVSLLEYVFLKKPYKGDTQYNERVAGFYQRCMQFSGPLMAKGVEDTLMYCNNRFIAHNEVGDAPGNFGISIHDFHKKMSERNDVWPLALNGTSTHDTKRGEDARARLNILSEFPELWEKKVNEWRTLNAELKSNHIPDDNDEYLIYQALIGAYEEEEEKASFLNRFRQYLEKALREGKTHSNWTEPNTSYEQGTKDFAAALLNEETAFWQSFREFYEMISRYGVTNSLIQVILKFTTPGIPDVYQGTELWDYSFVDPDNRRPVDYKKRGLLLQNLPREENETVLNDLWNKKDASIKLWVVRRMAQLRNQNTTLLAEGEYVPLKAEGKYKHHILAFGRKHLGELIIIVVPIGIARLCYEQDKEISLLNWEDTKIFLPKNIYGNLFNLISREEIKQDKQLLVKDIFNKIPFAIIGGKQKVVNKRGAGILLHLTSLPSSFCIGDMGPYAYGFVDFLKGSHQKYWQLLPLNPTSGGQGYSPYSATSSKAGYHLLISPEELVNIGLLSKEDLDPLLQESTRRVDYQKAEDIKGELLSKAFTNFLTKENAYKNDFEVFCDKEKYWLDDFACYSVLKNMNNGLPWYEWGDEWKLYDGNILSKVKETNEQPFRRLQWEQYEFTRQWKKLKEYANRRNIKLIGDLPFYISYDSADVWANRDIFSLDEKSKITAMAGVPPDSFSSDGQLWGMPVFNWHILKKQDYQWWIERIKKNIELFDLVRIDHFRAFSAFWEVAAGEETAKNGKWVEGPGSDFFKAVQTAIGSLPFIAEDLGEIDAPVYQLRDEFQFPGMKILQFAFGDDMPQSGYIPHNYTENFFVYPGTHDNNTTRGWFRQETDEETRNRIREYLGQEVGEENIHLKLNIQAYASIAHTAIIPLQDILGLDESARMNIPSSGTNNWSWKLESIPGHPIQIQLQHLVYLYNRG